MTDPSVAVRPYGSWPTPITSELVVRSARLPSGVQVDGADVWWSESRPEEGGRIAVLQRSADGRVEEVLAERWNARTAVHEYGGGAWWAHGGTLWFTDWASQRLHVVESGAAPLALTPEPAVSRGLRYADGCLSPDGTTLLCVREAHHADGTEAANTIVRLDAHAPSTPVVAVEGPDFVSDPRWRADGAAFCWLEWDHPDMPWDATRLIVDEGGQRTAVAGVDQRESVCQPTWSDDGSLWFAGDRTGFWSLYRWRADRGVEAVVELGKDIGFPQWVFGQTCFALLDDGRVAFVYRDGGLDRLATWEPHFGRVTDVAVPHTTIESLHAAGHDVVYVGASATTEPHVVRASLPVDGPPECEVLVPPRDLGLDPSWWSAPVPVEFPTAGGVTAHALLYPPTNPDVVAPAEDRPPLLVMIHGGPTSAARPMLQLSKQYWTSRGFAVVDVNYRGSSGYGRAYRELLRGAWGVADVEDCAAVCRFLADRGDVDPDRLCIRGGSAGGFTTLAALAFTDVFAAGASHYGIADLGVLAQDTHKFESRYLDGLVGPWPHARATYEARSPIFHADRITSPLVVFHGLDDPIVPPNQAEMIVEALRANGVRVEYVAFEGEQHGFRQADNVRAALDGELAFYTEVFNNQRL
ncbi:MAG: prolyl oligopeptidase family serine peptidase [Microthrixaceae bacterium]